ncbi:MAG: hypothetical protein ACOY3L_14625 [Pseudomonadota bacterium]
MTAGIIKLTERQFYAFVNDRLDGAGPCKVREDLPFAALACTSVLPGARILMRELEGRGARLTAKGNLNRKVVGMLLERFRWNGHGAAEIRSVSAVVNERDFPPAMYLHAVLKLAGLLHKANGFLKLTRKGQSLLPEAEAGRLQAALFRTTFARYNPAYLDYFDMPEIFAPQISLILYLIGQFCTDWRAADALMRSVTIPTKELTQPEYPKLPVLAFETRVLRYLCWFGLMEEGCSAANDDWRRPRLYRKTALYDRMLQFGGL